MAPSGPEPEFFAALRELRLRVGEPSVREIARRSGQVSHDTVHRVLTGPALPKWANVEAVVRALGADPDTVKPLWLAARAAGGSSPDEYRLAPLAMSLAPIAPPPELPEPAEIRVVVVDGQPLVRYGLVKFFADSGFVVVGEAANGVEALRVVADQRPDVVVMDLWLPELSGMDVLTRLVEQDSEARVLIVSMRYDLDSVGSAMRAGAMGYLRKESALEDILQSVRMAAVGIPVITGETATLMLMHARESSVDAPPALSERESTVLRLVASGLANPEIAAALGLSVRTVDTHLARIRDKLGVRSRTGLVKYAFENNYVGE